MHVPWHILCACPVQVHSWVIVCMPEVPARLQTEEAKFVFRNTFLGSLLLCEYRKGEASFRSDSVTSLAIVKEVSAVHRMPCVHACRECTERERESWWQSAMRCASDVSPSFAGHP